MTASVWLLPVLRNSRRSLVKNSDDDYCARTKNKQRAKTADKRGRDGREIKDVVAAPAKPSTATPTATRSTRRLNPEVHNAASSVSDCRSVSIAAVAVVSGTSDEAEHDHAHEQQHEAVAVRRAQSLDT